MCIIMCGNYGMMQHTVIWALAIARLLAGRFFLSAAASCNTVEYITAGVIEMVM